MRTSGGLRSERCSANSWRLLSARSYSSCARRSAGVLTRSPVRGSVIVRLNSPSKLEGYSPKYRLHELLQRWPTFVRGKPPDGHWTAFFKTPNGYSGENSAADRLRDR